MKLGTLSLFEKRGIFFKEEVHNLGCGIELNDLLELEKVDIIEPKLWNQPDRIEIIPVSADGKTDYVTGIFQDSGMMEGSYEVTIWLLLEEEPEITCDD
ncbi:hypothetical protein J8281_03560 [Aquimarina sp. U1-2]|uniref:hypothetical protein n=1 Tax=Aquimarina sp. U1-2 TaxID=2823141 RepID=UPI001AECE871|nr:hypothetical protein [Aquimarina sp. U1-2]MBP2831255.1 hypothetical protein [Aquimarina sp. U1-2]